AKDYMPDFSRSTQPQRKYYYDAEGYIGEVKPVPEYVQTAIRNAEIHPLSDMIRRNSTAPNKRLNYDFSTLRAYPQEPELYRQPYTGKDRRTELYGEKWGEGLDAASDTLAIASIIPGLDTYADLAAIPVDLLRGDYVSAGLDAIGAIPFVGEAADSAKLARIGFKAADAADAVHDVAKAADVVGDSINGAKNFSLKTAGNAGELATPYSADKIPDEVKRYLSDLTQYGDSIDVDLTPSFENISLMARQEAAEFASVTIGNRNIIIRGDINGTYISEELLEDMIKNKGILNCHSHPYIGDLQPSESDLWLAEVLNHQETFRIVTPDGMQAVYTAHGLQSVGPIERKLSEADMKELYNLFGG
ncbi:MAG: hypothetical protein IJP38_07020, partial [Oscillospiraceae bacterium]|nr:hypothetical protein [Oscillospiraceae bacterium]